MFPQHKHSVARLKRLNDEDQFKDPTLPRPQPRGGPAGLHHLCNSHHILGGAEPPPRSDRVGRSPFSTAVRASKTPGSNPAAVILPPSSRWTLRSHSSPTSPKSAMYPTNGKISAPQNSGTTQSRHPPSDSETTSAVASKAWYSALDRGRRGSSRQDCEND